MNSIVKNTIILTLITLFSGLMLGTVYQITKEPIANQQEKAKQEAYAAVFETAKSFDSCDYDISSEKTVLENAGITAEDVTEIVVASDENGNPLGYVFGVTTHEGYGGDIKISVGISLDGTVLGVEILEISETAGLGMRANTPEFKSQFANKTVDMFAYSKTGATADYEIDALSGATITSNAMTNGVNAALIMFREVTK